jgi:HlyD family secretion protein
LIGTKKAMKGLSMKSKKRKRMLVISAICILVIGIAAAWTFLKPEEDTGMESAEAQTSTTKVSRGSLILSTTGTGTLVAGETMDLSFATSGTVAEVNVEVGDVVSTDDVLAVLDDLDALEVEIDAKLLELYAAQEAVQNLYEYSEINLAEAQLSLAQAKEAYADAEKNVVQAGAGRCPQETTEQYYYDYIYAQRDVNEWESYLHSGTSGYGEDYILTKLAPLRETRDDAYINWQYCQAYTEMEAETSQATVELAEAELELSQAGYDNLLAVSGLDPDELAMAEAELTNAELQLVIAENALAGATIIAPMDGTVMEVAGEVGDTADTSTFISLADMERPNLEIYIDETDMSLMQEGAKVSVVFDAIPDRTFEGTVSQVEPMLVTVSNYDVVQGLVNLSDTQTSAGRNLLLGMGAEVELIAGEAENVLLVLVDALFDIEGDQATVWVENADGSFTSQNIELGIMDYYQAEVISGLKQGDTVSLEPIE